MDLQKTTYLYLFVRVTMIRHNVEWVGLVVIDYKISGNSMEVSARSLPLPGTPCAVLCLESFPTTTQLTLQNVLQTMWVLTSPLLLSRKYVPNGVPSGWCHWLTLVIPVSWGQFENQFYSTPQCVSTVKMDQSYLLFFILFHVKIVINLLIPLT